MNFVIAALTLGLAGSLHCLGMCGPLVVAVHHTSGNNYRWQHIVYNAFRILVYMLLGIATGMIGKTFVTLGFQRWLALVSGVLMLVFVLWPMGKGVFGRFSFTFISKLKSRFQKTLGQKGFRKYAILGALNGMLPCGLVYVALAASLTTGDLTKSVLFMMFFGLGTSPAMLFATRALSYLTAKFRYSSFRVVQLSLVCISMLVMLRGAGLGIPYLSPAFSEQNQKMECCHKP